MTDAYDGFDDWKDVQSLFGTDTPEPEQVYIAEYSHESYEGSAFIAYRNGDKYYTVEGGHCSCYGLEGQFEPEEYTHEQFLALIEKNQSGYRNYWKQLKETVV